MRSPGLVSYPDAVAAMERQADAIHGDNAPEAVWLLEHPPLYTAGTSAKPDDLLVADRLPVYQTGRGGQFTYHGPGQRVAYLMLDLSRRGKDVRQFVRTIERWIIDALAELGVKEPAAKAAPAFGFPGPKKVRWPRTRSRRSASASGAGSASTASASMSIPTSAIMTASSPAASTTRA